MTKKAAGRLPIERMINQRYPDPQEIVSSYIYRHARNDAERKKVDQRVSTRRILKRPKGSNGTERPTTAEEGGKWHGTKEPLPEKRAGSGQLKGGNILKECVLATLACVEAGPNGSRIDLDREKREPSKARELDAGGGNRKRTLVTKKKAVPRD